MILKKTFRASGSRGWDVGAELSGQMKDYLLETGLFRLVSVGTGYGDRPMYTLEFKESGYQIVLQSASEDRYTNIGIGINRSKLSDTVYYREVNFGTLLNATITIHIVTYGDSFAFKLFNYANNVELGGSCIRFTKFSGEQGYLYNSLEYMSVLGYIGRYEVESGKIASINYTDYPSTQHALIQELPIITLDDKAIGYANDIVTINVSNLSDSNAFSAFRFLGEEYHGGKITYLGNIWHVSSCTAAAMKGGM